MQFYAALDYLLNEGTIYLKSANTEETAQGNPDKFHGR